MKYAAALLLLLCASALFAAEPICWAAVPEATEYRLYWAEVGTEPKLVLDGDGNLVEITVRSQPQFSRCDMDVYSAAYCDERVCCVPDFYPADTLMYFVTAVRDCALGESNGGTMDVPPYLRTLAVEDCP